MARQHVLYVVKRNFETDKRDRFWRRLTGGKITINQSPKNFSGRYNDKKSRN